MTIPEIVSVNELVVTLASCNHNGFPVVRTEEKSGTRGPQKHLAGIILRRQLLVILRHKHWMSTKPDESISQEVANAFIGSFTSDHSAEARAEASAKPGAKLGAEAGGLFFKPTRTPLRSLRRRDSRELDVDGSVHACRRVHKVSEALLDSDMKLVIDLRPFLDPSPMTVSELLPLSKVYNLFNQIGVRHLPVVDDGTLVGIITRKGKPS